MKTVRVVAAVIKYLPRGGAMGNLKAAGNSPEERLNRERRRSRLW